MTSLLRALLLGLALGLLAKWTDTVPSNLPYGPAVAFLRDLTTRLGLWVLIAALLAAASPTPARAAARVFVFFAGLLVAYYLYTLRLFGGFPTAVFLRWGAIALLSPLAAWVVWQARGAGWPAALSAALPAGLLIAQGYPFVYTFAPVLAADWLFAGLLLWRLPPDRAQRLRASALALAVAILLRAARSLPLVPFLLGS
jgi:hypothetical protein